MAGILRKPDSKITKDLSEVEKQLGVDLKLTPDGDLELSNLSDFRLVAGVNNAAQAVYLKLFIEPGGLLFHPELGTDLLIGEKTSDALEIQAQIVRSLSKDDRFEDVRATVQIIEQTVFVDLYVTISDTGQEIPLKFAVLRRG